MNEQKVEKIVKKVIIVNPCPECGAETKPIMIATRHHSMFKECNIHGVYDKLGNKVLAY